MVEVFTEWMYFLMPNQPLQNTKEDTTVNKISKILQICEPNQPESKKFSCTKTALETQQDTVQSLNKLAVCKLQDTELHTAGCTHGLH